MDVSGKTVYTLVEVQGPNPTPKELLCNRSEGVGGSCGPQMWTRGRSPDLHPESAYFGSRADQDEIKDGNFRVVLHRRNK